jgi:hypothetical protein
MRRNQDSTNWIWAHQGMESKDPSATYYLPTYHSFLPRFQQTNTSFASTKIHILVVDGIKAEGEAVVSIHLYLCLLSGLCFSNEITHPLH